jgi:hypothetical protein
MKPYRPALIIICVLALVFSLLAACQPQNLPRNTDVPATHEANLTVLTPRINPSITPAPTLDPLTPTAIAAYFATQEAKTAALDITPTLYFEHCKGRGNLTADGQWALCDEYADPIVIINQSNQIWEFSYEAFFEQAIPGTCTKILHMTRDGKFIYFSLPLDCIMAEAGFGSTIAVFRMDLNNGSVVRVLGSQYNFQNYKGATYDVAISPTGRRIAYITQGESPVTLRIVDLQTGETISTPMNSKYSNGGRFTWSEEGTKLAFLLESQSQEPSGDPMISFVYLDMLKPESLVTFIKEKEYYWITTILEVKNDGVILKLYGETPLFFESETGRIIELSSNSNP